MIDPKDLKRSYTDGQIIEIRDKVRHQLWRVAEKKRT